MIDKFNIRVYGIWIRDQKILVSNENIDGFKMTKLPGGGLEFGEGPMDCVVREFKEELGVHIAVSALVHTSESFIQSAFKKNEQVIAIHYSVNSDDEIVSLKTEQSTNVGRINHHQFEWINLSVLDLERFTFEMDRLALHKLMRSKK